MLNFKNLSKNFFFITIYIISLLSFFKYIAWNEELFICFSVIIFFYILYIILRKIFSIYFFLDIEYIYLTFIYILNLNSKLNKNLQNLLGFVLKFFKYLKILIQSEINYIYLSLLNRKLINLKKNILLLDNLYYNNIKNKENFINYSIYIYLDKYIIPMKNYKLLNLNNLITYNFSILYSNLNFYDNSFFYLQYIYIVNFFYF